MTEAVGDVLPRALLIVRKEQRDGSPQRLDSRQAGLVGAGQGDILGSAHAAVRAPRRSDEGVEHGQRGVGVDDQRGTTEALGEAHEGAEVPGAAFHVDPAVEHRELAVQQGALFVVGRPARCQPQGAPEGGPGQLDAEARELCEAVPGDALTQLDQSALQHSDGAGGVLGAQPGQPLLPHPARAQERLARPTREEPLVAIRGFWGAAKHDQHVGDGLVAAYAGGRARGLGERVDAVGRLFVEAQGGLVVIDALRLIAGCEEVGVGEGGVVTAREVVSDLRGVARAEVEQGGADASVPLQAALLREAGVQGLDVTIVSEAIGVRRFLDEGPHDIGADGLVEVASDLRLVESEGRRDEVAGEHAAEERGSFEGAQGPVG